MAETYSRSLLHQPTQSHALQSLFHALDPISLLRSQTHRNPLSSSSSLDGGGGGDSDGDGPVPLRLITDAYVMERGPRYTAYAELRESRLLMKHARQHEPEDGSLRLTPPPKKQVKFQPQVATGRRGGGGRASLLAQSVPDFSAALRKENRRPPAAASGLPTLIELTPPSSKSSWSKANNGCGSGARGSKSVGAAVEKKGGLMARKSYANVEELKGLSCAVAGAINGYERGRSGTTTGRGGSSATGTGRTILGSRRF